MMNQAIEAGDAGTWASAVIAVVAVLYTYLQNRQQKKSQARSDELQRLASDAATRQAEALERRALATEQMLERLTQTEGQRGVEDQQPSSKLVEWSLSREKDLFVLRNEGDEAATEVRVTVGDHPAGLTRRLPEDAVVRAHEAVEFLILGAWGSPIPRQIHVAWAGHEEPLAVPVPSK